MKKIFTLILGLIATLSIGAQGFEFQYQGESLADDATVIIAAEEDMFGDMSCETNNPTNPTNGLMLKLLSGTTATGSAILEITHNTLDADMLQWCMGGDCTPLGSRTSLTKQFTVTDRTQVQFDAIAIQSEGFLTATLKATIGLESHKVNILFVNGDVDGIQTLPQEEDRKEAIYDLLGKQVKGRPSSGVYVVTDGIRTRKVAIK